MQQFNFMFEQLVSLNPWVIAIALNTVFIGLVGLSPKKLLTPAGLIHAWILGVLIWGCLGGAGYMVVGAYFILGSGVTRIGMAEKEAAGIAEKRGGARGPENVWGSALTATLCAFGILILQQFLNDSEMTNSLVPLLSLGYVASFSTKLSDTCASEVGKAYGKRTFLITTLQPVPRGTEGAVSLEGTLAGIVASVVIAVIGWSLGWFNSVGIVWCAIAAFVATNLESVIGATVQEQVNWLTNEVVNFLNTLMGAMVAMLLAQLWQYSQTLLI